jgi:cell division protein FtsQ
MTDAMSYRQERSVQGPRYGRFALLLFACAALFVLCVLGFSRIKVSRLEVRAGEGLTVDSIRESVSSLVSGESFMLIDAQRVRAGLLANPLIASARVYKGIPGTLVIEANGRSPVAMALCEIDGRSVPMLIDQEGLAFKIDSSSATLSLPLISGLRFANPKAGMRLPDSLKTLFASLAGIERSEPGLIKLISEIKVLPVGSDRVELLIYTVSCQVPVRTRADLSAETLRSAALVLDILKTRGLTDTVSELDLRTGTMVYKTKEGGL